MPAHEALLNGKVGLVVGIANEHSIAAGCAQALKCAGAELAVTYLNEKAKPFVEPVAQSVEAAICMPLDVQVAGELEAVIEAIATRWGRLDFLVHSIANCPKDDLHGRVVDSSAQGFSLAMDVSVHSFLRMAHLVEPLMKEGGCLLTMSYYGAEKVVDRYNIMGPVKAALESTVRYMAAELGPKGIRVNAISPGPLKTRAASGIAQFDDLIEEARARAPEHHLISMEDVGAMAAFLISDQARNITGNITFVDAGAHVMA
jgi:enoyl-[acyl-carrier protein] reductase I